MMNSRKKMVIAAALAAVMGLTGCSTNNERSGAFSYNYDYSSEPAVSSDSSEISKPETDSSEIGESETDSSVSAPAESSTESTSGSNDYADRLHEIFGDKTVGEIMAEAEAEREKTSKADKRTEAEKLVDALIDELKLNDNKKSDMEKLCILGKWFCDNTEYDYELVGTADAIYNAGKAFSTEDEVEYLLTKHSGKCSSYAKAACLILSECGIDTLYCKSNSTNHGWNAVKINGQWTYTDFVGGPDTLILGSSYHGVPKDTFIHWCTTLNRGYSGARPDVSEVSTELRLFDFNGKELQVHKEADGFSYVNSSGQTWICTF